MPKRAIRLVQLSWRLHHLSPEWLRFEKLDGLMPRNTPEAVDMAQQYPAGPWFRLMQFDAAQCGGRRRA
jgi:hypothetical protein